MYVCEHVEGFVRVGTRAHYQTALLGNKTAGEAPLKSPKWRLLLVVIDVHVDTSKDSAASMSGKNGHHPPTCSSQKPCSHTQVSYSHSSPYPFHQTILSTLLQNISQIPPLLLTSTAISVVPVTISSGPDQASSTVSLFSPLLPHTPLSTQQSGRLLKNIRSFSSRS